MRTEKDSIPTQDKYLLTCREASLYFNIGIKNMRRMASDPYLKISVKLRGRRLIVRPKIEEYVLQLLEDEPKEDLSQFPNHYSLGFT